MADRYFEAGLELAELIGVQCTDTETVIRFTRKELLNALQQAPEALVLGSGTDRVTLKARKPEDTTKPLFCTSLSIQIDEPLYPALVSGLIHYRGIDILQGPSIDTIFGHPAFSGTPFETAAGIREAQLREEAIWRAGRPDIAQMGMSSSVTEFGFMAGFMANHKVHNPRIAICLQPSELKTNYCNFNKVLTAASCGSFLRTGCPSMIGGYSGPPEGSAIANIASDILQFALFGTDHFQLLDVRCAAKYRLLPHRPLGDEHVRPGDLPQYPHHSGQDHQPDRRPLHGGYSLYQRRRAHHDLRFWHGADDRSEKCGGALKNYLTPLEAYFCADVFKAAAGLRLDQALEIVNYCLGHYEEHVADQPKGQSYYECYDRATGKPSAQWEEIDARVRTDLRRFGLSL